MNATHINITLWGQTTYNTHVPLCHIPLRFHTCSLSHGKSAAHGAIANPECITVLTHQHDTSSLVPIPHSS